MNTVQIKDTALHLRRSGLSYGEILKKINIPKSTLAYWLRGMTLEEDQESALKSRVHDKQKRGRFSTAIALRARKVYREKATFEAAEKEFLSYSSDPFFLIGVSLYWAHGGKKSGHFQFTSSDPEMAILMIAWTEKYLLIPRNELKYRLFIRESYKDQSILDFWATTLQIKKTLFQKPIYTGSAGDTALKNRSISYKGSLCVTITNVTVLRRVIAWQNLLIKYYKETMLS
jgi:hypothetical protein